MDSFVLNGYFWRVRYVDPRDPMLVDRTNTLTVATTDPIDKIVYLSRDLRGNFLIKVLLHELGHCTMHSYGLIDDIHRMVLPEHWIEAEEWVCNFIADYGFRIFSTAYSILGPEAMRYIPKELERLVS